MSHPDQIETTEVAVAGADPMADAFSNADNQSMDAKERQESLPVEEVSDPETKNDIVKKTDTAATDDESLQKELEKARKSTEENQRYARQNSRRLKNAITQTKALIESGVLSDEEAQDLLASLDSGDDERGQASVYAGHPFGEILSIANNELTNLRKYSEDTLLDEKVKAFDSFMSLASRDDVGEVIDELAELKDDPIKLTKKILSVGQQFHEESYGDIAKSGSVRNYIKAKNDEIKNLNKNIDKLNKKLAEYGEIGVSTGKLSSMSDVAAFGHNHGDPMGHAFDTTRKK